MTIWRKIYDKNIRSIICILLNRNSWRGKYFGKCIKCILPLTARNGPQWDSLLQRYSSRLDMARHRTIYKQMAKPQKAQQDCKTQKSKRNWQKVTQSITKLHQPILHKKLLCKIFRITCYLGAFPYQECRVRMWRQRVRSALSASLRIDGQPRGARGTVRELSRKSKLLTTKGRIKGVVIWL